MMGYDRALITIGLVCLVLGQCFGVWMGVNEDFTLAPAHAHLNLAGGVLLCLYGLIHRSYPTLARTRLARLQACFAVIGALAMPAGIVMAITTHDIFVGLIGATSLVLALVMFIIMFVGKAKAA